MTTTLDLTPYLNRKVDVLAWHGATSAGERQLSATLADEQFPGEITTGIQKLAQRFVITLLTERGSARYAEDTGTDLMTDLRAGRVRSTDQLLLAFMLAERDAARQLKAEETDDDPDDERYESAALTAATLSGDTVIMYIQLQSRAEKAAFILPIPLVV